MQSRPPLNQSAFQFASYVMKRLDCLKLLAPMVDEHVLTVTSLSSNTAFWSDLRREGANFFGCNMGLCIPFALGLTAAFPKRKVIALEGAAHGVTSQEAAQIFENPIELDYQVVDGEERCVVVTVFDASERHQKVYRDEKGN